MSLPFGWIWPTLAGIATAIAIVGRDDPVLAISGATFAVVTASLALAGVVRRPAADPLGTPELGPVSPGRVREAFRSQTLGREDLVLLLDRIERAGRAPNLPLRSSAELKDIIHAPDETFRRYLTARVEAIEGSS
ncbi:MAG: hypothetical protein ACLQD8_01985 [Thermoplasmata archaeon]